MAVHHIIIGDLDNHCQLFLAAGDHVKLEVPHGARFDLGDYPQLEVQSSAFGARSSLVTLVVNEHCVLIPGRLFLDSADRIGEDFAQYRQTLAASIQQNPIKETTGE